MQSQPASEALRQLLPAVRLNLARALVKAGQPSRAAALYEQLAAAGQLPERGDLPEQAADWLSFGQALAGSGQPVQAKSAFQHAMSPAAPTKVFKSPLCPSLSQVELLNKDSLFCMSKLM